MRVVMPKWYKYVIFIWLLTGLPIYILGQGFMGIEQGAFTWESLLINLQPPTKNIGAFITWLIPTVLIFLPILAAPFAIRFRRSR